MSFLHGHISEIDMQISQFARAIALPIRVFILRMIIANGNSINKQSLYSLAFNAQTINKHLMELKALGIIKVKNVRTQPTYSVDEQLFDSMSSKFNLLFDQPDQKDPDARLLPPPEPPSLVERGQSEESVFGAYIRQQRLELNLTQTALAHKTGIDRALLSRIESGKKQPDAEKLPLLAKALQLKVSDLSIRLSLN